jgi:chromate transporter
VFRATRHIGGFGLSFDAPVLTSLDVWSLILALGVAIVIFRFKIGMIPTLMGGCVVSGVLHAIGLVALAPL